MPGQLFRPHVYRHSQIEPADHWLIKHNLGSNNGSQGVPIVDVIVTVGGVVQRIIPKDVDIIDIDTIVISFTAPYAGTASVIV